MNVLGFREADQEAVALSLPEGVAARVVALPMLAVLKVMAWEDRHRRRPGTDSNDLLHILRNFLEAGNEARLYDEFSAMLQDPNFDQDYFSAWLAGPHSIRIRSFKP